MPVFILPPHDDLLIFLERGLMGSMMEPSVRFDVRTVRERIGFLIVLRGTANPVHQFGEPAVKVSIDLYSVRARAVISPQLFKLALY
jgi:hypothetical protein